MWKWTILGAALAAACHSSSPGRTDDSATVDVGPDALTGTSIRQWAVCDGVTDDHDATVAAFAAAANHAFNLIVDCPLRVVVGHDIAKPIFVPDGLTVAFTSAGTIYVDNVYLPEFVFEATHDIELLGWNLEYDGGLPAAMNAYGGFDDNGVAVASNGDAPVASAFNDITRTAYMKANLGVTFGSGTNAPWDGPTDTAAIFFVDGGVTNLTVSNMTAKAKDVTDPTTYIPMLFALMSNWKAGTAITKDLTMTGSNAAVSSGLTFSNIDLDGTIFGWQGNTQNTTWDHITSRHYADLTGPNNTDTGGVDHWFAPPHLFYLNYNSTGDTALFNQNLTVTNVIDYGQREGIARDLATCGMSGYPACSGNALSLKIGGTGVTVNGYQSSRPDGFLDVLWSHGMTIENVTASYDSSFTNGIFPGWRFPASPVDPVEFDHIQLTDVAATPLHAPVTGLTDTASTINMTDVTVSLSNFDANVVPGYGGGSDSIAMTFNLTGANETIQKAQKNAVAETFKAQPVSLSAGGSTTLTWSTTGAASCAASGDWTPAIGTTGSMAVTLSAAGNHSFTLTCTSAAGDVATTTMPVTVTP